MITRSNTNGNPFVSSYDMFFTRYFICNVCTDILQKRIGNACEEINFIVKECFIHFLYIYHNYSDFYFVPGINSSISLIGIQNGRTSCARSFSNMVRATLTIAGYAARSIWLAYITMFTPHFCSSDSYI